MTRVVVDADYLVYSIGVATERVWYDIAAEREDGTVDEAVVRYKDEVEAWFLGEPAGTVRHIEERVEADPLSHALFLVDRVLNSIDAALTEAKVEFDRMELYLTGKNNFRDTLATIRGYKANRIGRPKPTHYASIRRYLKNRWGAVVVDGYEADDEVAMIAASYDYDPARCIIVSMDKDLRTVPGGHFHFKRKKLEVLTEAQARCTFYRQMLTGDVVDNVAGAFRIGEKIAKARITEDMSEEDQWRVTLELYGKNHGKDGCPYNHLTPYDAAVENGRLLHMLRRVGDVWRPPVAGPEPSTDLSTNSESESTLTKPVSRTRTRRKRSSSSSQ